MQPDRKLGPQDWFEAYGSHYEGTPYDTTKGIAAGPFGTPDRYATPGKPGDPGTGSWERTVAIYRTAYTWVVTANAAHHHDVAGVVWWGVADASKTSFAPLMVSMGVPPRPLTVGRQSALDRQSAYWAVRYVQNLCQIRYEDMIADVQATTRSLQVKASTLVSSLQSPTDRVNTTPASIKQLLDRHVEEIVAAYWQLADDLMVKFADGGLTEPQADGTVTTRDLGYPSHWLNSKEVEFTEGPARLPGPAGDPPATAPISTLLAFTPAPEASLPLPASEASRATAVGLFGGLALIAAFAALRAVGSSEHSVELTTPHGDDQRLVSKGLVHHVDENDRPYVHV